jgi:hypothetical protein
MPKSIQCNITNNEIPSTKMPDPCKILYKVKSEEPIGHVEELIKDQMKKTFDCPISNVVFRKE